MPRFVPPYLQQRLEHGAATLTEGIRVVTRGTNPQQLGFCRHHHDVTVDGQVYRARPNMMLSRVEAQIDMSVDNSEATGVFYPGVIEVEDLLGTRYQGAYFERSIFDTVDTNLSTFNRIVFQTGTIGGVQIADGQFKAELRSLFQLLQTPVGWYTSPSCRVPRLGDNLCKVNLNGTSPQGYPYRASAVVTGAASPYLTLQISVTGSFPAGWFNNGSLLWLTAAAPGLRNVGLETTVRTFSGTTIVLQYPEGWPVLVGDTCQLTAGCRRTIKDCFEKFNNAARYQGEPYMVGDRSIYQYYD